MTALIRVYVVDDQPIIRDGLQYMINHQSDMTVVGTAGSAAHVLDKCRETEPDIILLDIRLPDGSGLEVAQSLAALNPAPKILLLTTFDVAEYVLEALRAGAMGYVLKDLPSAELLDTIRAVFRGEAIYRTRSASWALSQMIVQSPPHQIMESPTEGEILTEREKEVLQRMAYGERNADIANALCVSEGTVKSHVHSILQKLHVEDRTQAVVWAFRHGLVR